MTDEQLFSGIAVVVDDEVEDPKSAIGQICASDQGSRLSRYSSEDCADCRANQDTDRYFVLRRRLESR